MTVSYKKLWKMLIDQNMKKSELARRAGIGNYTVCRMTAGRAASLAVIEKICRVLNCGVDDILEFVDDDDKWVEER